MVVRGFRRIIALSGASASLTLGCCCERTDRCGGLRWCWIRSSASVATSARAATPNGWRSGRGGWTPRPSRRRRRPHRHGGHPARAVLRAQSRRYKTAHLRPDAERGDLASDKADGPTAGTEPVDPLEGLARVLVHIPDKGHMTTRYDGRYANRPDGMRGKAPTEAACQWAALLQQIFEVTPSRARPATAPCGSSPSLPKRR